MSDPAKQKGQGLRPGRLEAFSDGVFAIAITLLVLDLAVPSIEEGNVGHGLITGWPMYVAYLVSFASIGAAWVAHATITEHLERVDFVLMRLNLLLLFFVSVLPFPTKMLGDFAHHPDAERWAVTIYGITLLAISAMTSVVWRHAVSERLISDEHPKEHVQLITAKLTPSLWLYVVAILVGLALPQIAIVLYLAIALFLLVPFRAIFQHVGRRHDA
jgi:uncharacterized membrane protein